MSTASCHGRNGSHSDSEIRMDHHDFECRQLESTSVGSERENEGMIQRERS